MNATKSIMDNLRAMGAAPTVKRDQNGNDFIKINAPQIPTERKPENKTRKEDNRK